MNIGNPCKAFSRKLIFPVGFAVLSLLTSDYASGSEKKWEATVIGAVQPAWRTSAKESTIDDKDVFAPLYAIAGVNFFAAQRLETGYDLFGGDIIRTGTGGKVTICFKDLTITTVGENSVIRIQPSPEPSFFVKAGRAIVNITDGSLSKTPAGLHCLGDR